MTVPDSKEFKSLEGFVSEKTLNAISDMGFTTMMEIQHKSIVPLLKGRYIVVQKLLYYYGEHFVMPSLVPHIMLSEDLCRNSILPTSAGQSLRFLVARCRSRGGPPLFLDQTEAQRAKKTFWRLHPGPPVF